MKNITVLPDAHEIRDKGLIELFDAKADFLSRDVDRFNEIGIAATIWFKGRQSGPSLLTFVAVECEDEGFRQLLEQALEAYNNIPSLLN